ncbi:het domain-containing protein [Seiridium cupressi]
MRLIDTHTHLLLEPWKAAGKEYAILSHTWGAEEVIFQEWEQLFPSGAIKGQCPHVRHTGIENKAGYHKVIQACEQAKRDGICWLWSDTMCINKESSAELSEAINSMYKWYSEAKICYVYLTDVTFPDRESHLGMFAGQSDVKGWFLNAMEHKRDDLMRIMQSRFMNCRWWTRGWTLQELLAPLHVVFFSEDWTLLGRKSEIAPWVSVSTKIHKEVLEDRAKIKSYSIAQRMSWAADRTTTVVEDMAYCLLGIFDINMPMLYGQGRNAFRKLQEEIINRSDDQSIFAWTCIMSQAQPWTGAFAVSPESFRDCGSIVHDIEAARIPFSLTNLGLKLKKSYTVQKAPAAIDIHLAVSTHRKAWDDALSPTKANPVVIHSGITVNVGFGNMRKVSRVYLNICAPLEFRTFPISPRRASCLSHEIVSSGLFVIVLTVLWNDRCEPRSRTYTTFMDKNNQIVNSVGLHIAQAVESGLEMEFIHRHIRSVYNRAVANGQDEAPMVLMEDDSLVDLNGQREITVDIIFTEKRGKLADA